MPGSIPGGTAKIKGPDVNGRPFDLQSKRMGSIPTVSTKKTSRDVGESGYPACFGSRRTRKFESCHPDKKIQYIKNFNYLCTMKNILKDPRLYFFLWIVLSVILAITLGGCKQKPLVEQGDVVKKIVVDSVEVLPPHSTIETDNRYRCFTSDSSEFISSTKYRVGDTITCVYKKH